MNAINFIDGLDGLAAGIVAVAALSFLAYSYTLIKTVHSTSQSLPAVASALLAGMCIGFLPHNFYPARIFMGDIGAMLLGLLLAYGPISSTDSLDPALLTNYAQSPTLDRFPTFLPLLVPAAIFIIPYADLMFAIIRRTRAGKPIMAADRQHLHHRLLNIGHSYRQSVLIMYLWAALFSVAVVSLSIVRSPSVVFFAATLVAVLALLPATMPRLRPWRSAWNKAAPAVAARAANLPASPPPAANVPASPPLAAPSSAAPVPASTMPADSLPRAGRLPGADPFPGPPAPNGHGPASSVQVPFPSQAPPFPSQDPFSGQSPSPGTSPFSGTAPFSAAAGEPGEEPADGHDSFPSAQRPDAQPR
jgi:UDP-GlcNAc:undecaprenyl-phosphate GlcNAc-1-phosphate transferase